AANPAQGWRVAFDADGAAVQPAGGEWTWRLRVLAYGYPGSERTVSVPLRLTAAGNRVDYTWDENLTEWWRNSPDGGKPTFVLTQRPAPPEMATPLAITVRVGGNLRPQLAETGQAVTFNDARGVARLRYRELVVTDAGGRRVPAWIEVRDEVVRL